MGVFIQFHPKVCNQSEWHIAMGESRTCDKSGPEWTKNPERIKKPEWIFRPERIINPEWILNPDRISHVNNY